MQQHAWKCTEQRLGARSLTQWSGGPTCWWHGNTWLSATATPHHPPPQLQADHTPSPPHWIAFKLSKNIEHGPYDGSPANQGAAAPWSPSMISSITGTESGEVFSDRLSGLGHMIPFLYDYSSLWRRWLIGLLWVSLAYQGWLTVLQIDDWWLDCLLMTYQLAYQPVISYLVITGSNLYLSLLSLMVEP